MNRLLISVLTVIALCTSACQDDKKQNNQAGGSAIEAPNIGDISTPIDSIDKINDFLGDEDEENIAVADLETEDTISEQPEIIKEIESQGDPLFIAPQCPKISSDYEKAISELRDLKTKILHEAGCETLVEATSRLEGVTSPKNRAIYEKILLERKKGKMISAKSAALLEVYSQQVAESVANIFNVMEVTDCPVVKEKKPLIFKALLGISFDAIAGLGDYLGPYGAPLSIGITALKGVVNGLFSFVKKNKGYKFNVSEAGRGQAILYSKSLCLFYKFKNEAEMLLNVSDRRDSYLNLSLFLNKKIKSMTAPGICEGCGSLVSLVTSYNEVNSVTKQLVADINSNSRGLQLGTHMLDALQTKLWLSEQMEKLEIEEDSFQESIGPAILGAELEVLEDFLVYKESTDFMKWMYNETNAAHKRFAKHANSWATKAHTDMWSAARANERKKNRGSRSTKIVIPFPATKVKNNVRNSVSLYDFKEMLIAETTLLPSGSPYNDVDLVEAQYNKSIKVLKNVNRFISSHNEYCGFFKLAGYYDAIYSNCNNKKMDDLNDSFLRHTLPDPNLSKYLQKTKDDREKVKQMTSGLEEWNKHLNKLFNKWERVYSTHTQNLLSEKN